MCEIVGDDFTPSEFGRKFTITLFPGGTLLHERSEPGFWSASAPYLTILHLNSARPLAARAHAVGCTPVLRSLSTYSLIHQPERYPETLFPPPPLPVVGFDPFLAGDKSAGRKPDSAVLPERSSNFSGQTMVLNVRFHRHGNGHGDWTRLLVQHA